MFQPNEFCSIRDSSCTSIFKKGDLVEHYVFAHKKGVICGPPKYIVYKARGLCLPSQVDHINYKPGDHPSSEEEARLRIPNVQRLRSTSKIADAITPPKKRSLSAAKTKSLTKKPHLATVKKPSKETSSASKPSEASTTGKVLPASPIGEVINRFFSFFGV